MNAIPPGTDEKRAFRSLRLSLTEDCNMRCTYCVEEGASRSRSASVPVEMMIDRVHRLHRSLNLHEVRLTGGEPMLYSQLPVLIGGIRRLGLSRISLTSNGLLLTEKKALELKAAGLTDLNLSLDAASVTTFERMGGVNGVRGLERVQKAVRAACLVDLPVKLNCTVLRGWNDHEIIDLLDYALDQGIVIRFLELMRMGPTADRHEEWFYPVTEMLEQIGKRYSIDFSDRDVAATARYYDVRSDNRFGRFGTIANHSEPFCSDCDRLRLSADGQLFGCLSYPFGAMMPGDDTELQSVLVDLLRTKKKRFTGSSLSMKFIGG